MCWGYRTAPPRQRETTSCCWFILSVNQSTLEWIPAPHWRSTRPLWILCSASLLRSSNFKMWHHRAEVRRGRCKQHSHLTCRCLTAAGLWHSACLELARSSSRALRANHLHVCTCSHFWKILWYQEVLTYVIIQHLNLKLILCIFKLKTCVHMTENRCTQGRFRSRGGGGWGNTQVPAHRTTFCFKFTGDENERKKGEKRGETKEITV